MKSEQLSQTCGAENVAAEKTHQLHDEGRAQKAICDEVTITFWTGVNCTREVKMGIVAEQGEKKHGNSV